MVDVEEDEAQSQVGKLRKAAGVPELPADGLPSGIACKIMCFGESQSEVPRSSKSDLF